MATGRLLRLIPPLAAVALAVLVFALVWADAAGRLRAEAEAAARLRVEALESVLAKQRAVAAILSDDDAVRAGLASGTGFAAISRKLDRLRAETQSAVIYLIGLDGVAVAASNWDEGQSFVGANYGFRDYFRLALRQGSALEFALGTVSHRPGLYLSHDVRAADGATVLGVVVVKVEFDALEAAWAASPDATWVVDAAGLVVLSGRPDLRFGPPPVPGAGQLVVRVPVPGAGWELVLATTGGPALHAGIFAGGAAGTVLLLAGEGLWRILLARRRALVAARAEQARGAELERAVQDRTRDLREEVHERRLAEQRLAGMQADLVQANKLATLGQVTAGLAHEVNQPLATIRLLAENAQALLPRRPPPGLRDTLDAIVRMSERIAQITAELRSFARKATGQIQPVPLREVIEASLLLTASRRRAEGARVIVSPVDPGLRVMVEAVRLEQVLVNLIQNAHEALAGRPDPEIRITVEPQGDRVSLDIADNGPGLAPAIAAQLFTPFATSKPDGLGLGLVIAQGIVRDFGGELRADPPRPGEGARFRLDLPRGPA